MKKAKQFLGFIIFIGLSLSAISQKGVTKPIENYHEADSGKIFIFSEIPPSFPDGEKARMNFLKDNIVYPQSAKDKSIQGTVYVRFVVEKDGRLTHISVLRGVSSEIDHEVVRIVKKMPNWKAGKHKDEFVRTKFIIPVRFSLPPDDKDPILILVEDQASFPGGQKAMDAYFKKNIKYPDMAMKSGIQGIVYLQFVVEKDGSITNLKVLRGIGGGCDEEAIRVAEQMPKWNSGKQLNKPIREQFNIPVKFKLQEENIPPKDSLINEGVTEDIIPTEEDSEDKKEEEVFVFVENQAGFPGGEKARMQYFAKHITYPELAKENDIQGTVFLKFIVEKDGSISNVTVVRGIGGGCDEEAMRVIREMPKWTPAKQRGKPVRVWYNMPIKFTLYSGNSKEDKISKKEQKKLRKQKRKEAKH